MNPFSPSRRLSWRWAPWLAALGYAILGALWLLFAQELAVRLFASEIGRTHARDLFSWLFVAASALGLLWLLQAATRPLRQSRRALANTIESMVDAVLVVDGEGRILEANRAAVGLLAARDASELLVSAADFCRRFGLRNPAGAPLEVGDSPIGRALAGATVRREEAILRAADGTERFVAMSAAPVDGERPMPVTLAVVSFEDIGEMKRLERLREEFLSIAAHELKTPLTSVKGYAQLLRRRGLEGAQADRGLEVINRQCDRMNQLVEDLLDLSRVDLGRLSLRTQRCELHELAAEAVAHVQPLTSRHQLLLDCEPGACVEADRERVEQVLVNLLDNAVKFSPHGGLVRVSVSRGPDGCVVRVEDQGLGISEDERSHVFERFYQAHPGRVLSSRGGMGIGLTIAREVVERHGGRIWFESELGKGSAFCFSLPYERPSEAADSSPAA